MNLSYFVEINGRAFRGPIDCGSAGLPEFPGLRIALCREDDPDTGISRLALRVENGGDGAVSISRAEPAWEVRSRQCVVRYFTSNWGCEFEPVVKTLSPSAPCCEFGTYSGRSTKGCDTWLGLEHDGGAQCAALAWSGNWDARACLDPRKEALEASMGITSRGFSHALRPGECFEGAEVFVTSAERTIEECCFQLRRYFRRKLSILPRDWDSLPFAYNGWWPHEDKLINEEVMAENARVAGELGCTHATMDAGWFGPEKAGENWEDKRGDWDIVNPVKFPSGMAALGNRINGMGIGFGIWCEIEAVGPKAALNETHPELIARRDGVSLGSVCMGSEKTRAWAMGILSTLVEEYHARWIKLDFNLDHGAGCDCEEHGHGKHDGLYAHVKGYYRFLDEVRAKYPDVILEDCSSGGLRIDLGILQREHFAFLSDPDYTEHHQQCFWGVTSYVHPSSAFHFSWSQTLIHDNRDQEPIQENMPRHKFDYIIRSVLTGTAAVSYRLVEFPRWCLERLKEHIAFYKEISGKYLLNGDMLRLTAQPLQNQRGERWCAYQYLAEDGNALAFVFRLEQSEPERVVRFQHLDLDALYHVTTEDGGLSEERTGRELMCGGLRFSGMLEESSEIVRLHRVGQ